MSLPYPYYAATLCKKLEQTYERILRSKMYTRTDGRTDGRRRIKRSRPPPAGDQKQQKLKKTFFLANNGKTMAVCGQKRANFEFSTKKQNSHFFTFIFIKPRPQGFSGSCTKLHHNKGTKVVFSDFPKKIPFLPFRGKNCQKQPILAQKRSF